MVYFNNPAHNLPGLNVAPECKYIKDMENAIKNGLPKDCEKIIESSKIIYIYPKTHINRSIAVFQLKDIDKVRIKEIFGLEENEYTIEAMEGDNDLASSFFAQGKLSNGKQILLKYFVSPGSASGAAKGSSGLCIGVKKGLEEINKLQPKTVNFKTNSSIVTINDYSILTKGGATPNDCLNNFYLVDHPRAYCRILSTFVSMAKQDSSFCKKVLSSEENKQRCSSFI